MPWRRNNSSRSGLPMCRRCWRLCTPSTATMSFPFALLWINDWTNFSVWDSLSTRPWSPLWNRWESAGDYRLVSTPLIAPHSSTFWIRYYFKQDFAMFVSISSNDIFFCLNRFLKIENVQFLKIYVVCSDTWFSNGFQFWSMSICLYGSIGVSRTHIKLPGLHLYIFRFALRVIMSECFIGWVFFVVYIFFMYLFLTTDSQLITVIKDRE